MPTQRVAVIGIDGSGKSTIIREISKRLSSAPGDIRAFRSFQVYDDPDLPLCGLSQSLDLLSGLADELKLHPLKAIALFLGMTVYGPVERFIVEVHAPRLLITERHPVIDSMAYAKFYLPLMSGPVDPALEGVILDRLAHTGMDPRLALDRIYEWVAKVPDFEGKSEGLWNLPLALRSLFALPPQELLQRLCVLFRTGLPDDTVLLNVPIDVAESRISATGADGRDATRDLHETREALIKVQGAYQKICGFLKEAVPTLGVHSVSTENVQIDEVIGAILGKTGALS